MSTVQNESLQRDGCFIVSEANKTRARTKGTLASGQNLKAGTVVAQVATGTASSAAKTGGNTGTGAMGAVTVGAGAVAGVYRLRIITAATNAGDFEVIDPQGDVSGIGHVAAAYNAGGLSFTLADGGTDFVVGDGFDITVAQGTGVYTQLNMAGTHGEAVAVGILFGSVDATAAAKPCVVFDDDAEVHPAKLIWPVGISATDKANSIAALRALGIKMSPTY